MRLDCQLNFHARRHMIAKHLNHPPHRQTIFIGLLGNLRHNDLTVGSAAIGAKRNHDVLSDAGVFRTYKLHTILIEKATCQLRGVA